MRPIRPPRRPILSTSHKKASPEPGARIASRSQRRFDAWVAVCGGVEATADLCECSKGMVSALRAGSRQPSRKLASRIQSASRNWERGPILATAWD